VRLKGLLEQYRSDYAEEIVYRDFMLNLLKIEGNDAFFRTCKVGQFTASSWLINSTQRQFLLMHHRKLDRWLQPGGHCDGNLDVLAVAIKEAQEETGMQDIVVVNENIFDLDIHFIPKRKSEHTHLHFDVRFLLKSQNDHLDPNHESFDVRWFSKNEDQFIDTVGMRRMYDKWCQHLDTRCGLSSAH